MPLTNPATDLPAARTQCMDLPLKDTSNCSNTNEKVVSPEV